MMDSQNINSFISNFNYASTPDNLGQIFYNEESSIEQRSFTSAADPVNMQSNRLAGLPGWTMKGKGLDSPRWLSSVSITAIIDLLLELYPNFFSSNLFTSHFSLSPRGVHFVSKSKALEHVLANGGLQEEVNHSSFLCLLCSLCGLQEEVNHFSLFAFPILFTCCSLKQLAFLPGNFFEHYSCTFDFLILIF